VLDGADLSGAKLNEADLSLSDMGCVNLSGADLENTDITRVDLRRVQSLSYDSVRAAYLSQLTSLPESITRAMPPDVRKALAELGPGGRIRPIDVVGNTQ
jgi:uncharacterized protein YjbI with pentapeptide repeats